MLVTRRSAQGEFIIKGGYSMQIKKTFLLVTFDPFCNLLNDILILKEVKLIIIEFLLN